MKKQELKTIIEELNKKISSLETTSEFFRKDKEKAKNELEDMHQLLDQLPGVVDREVKEEGSWVVHKNSPMTRLASYLAYVANERLTQDK